jgi:hypothetical protein
MYFAEHFLAPVNKYMSVYKLTDQSTNTWTLMVNNNVIVSSSESSNQINQTLASITSFSNTCFYSIKYLNGKLYYVKSGGSYDKLCVFDMSTLKESVLLDLSVDDIRIDKIVNNIRCQKIRLVKNNLNVLSFFIGNGIGNGFNILVNITPEDLVIKKLDLDDYYTFQFLEQETLFGGTSRLYLGYMGALMIAQLNNQMYFMETDYGSWDNVVLGKNVASTSTVGGLSVTPSLIENTKIVFTIPTEGEFTNV